MCGISSRRCPWPLTVIVHAQPSLQWDLGETKGTVALRMPDDEAALDLLREVGPMAVTSANRTGGPPAHSVLEAATALGAAVEVYLDGGPRADLAPSTSSTAPAPSPRSCAWAASTPTGSIPSPSSTATTTCLSPNRSPTTLK